MTYTASPRACLGEIDVGELTELVQDAWLAQAFRRRGETWLAELRQDL